METVQTTLFGEPAQVATSRRSRKRTPPSIREAIAPYIDADKLRQLITSGQTENLDATLRSREAPQEVYDLLRLMADLLRPSERTQIKSPSDMAALLMVEMSHLDQEELRVVCLDTKNRVQKIATVYVGSLNASIVRVGEVFKEAIRLNSAAIIVAHQHPSGDPTPSPEDVLVTRQIVEAGHLLDIPCLDHLVVGKGRFVSMRERGLGFGS